MVCNVIKFSVVQADGCPDPVPILDLLRRRGAYIMHDFEVYRTLRRITGLQMCIPVEFPKEPFFETLKDSGAIHWIDEQWVEKNIIPRRDF